jgi:hypothetical protein
MADSKKLLVYGDQEKANQQRTKILVRMYVQDYSTHQINQKESAPASYQRCPDNSEKNISTTLLGQLREKYFDYFVFNIGANCGLQHSGARLCALAETIGNARGLDINSSRSAETHAQDLRFRRHQQRDNPNNARGLDYNFASDRDCDSATTTQLRHRQLRPRHPIKAKFSSSKSRLLFPFTAPNTRGLCHEKSSCISLTLKNCESPSSWRSLSNT